MKKQYAKFFSVFLIVVFLLVALFYIVQINKLELVLFDDKLDYEAYSFISKNDFIAKVDEDKSNYAKLNIYIKNDDFEEYNLDEETQLIYDAYGLKIVDKSLVPIGKDVEIRYEAVKSNSIKEIVLRHSLKHEPEIKVYGRDKKELSNDAIFIISTKDELEAVLDLRAHILKFGQLAEEVPLTINHSINTDQNGKYTVILEYSDHNFKKEFEIIVKKPVKIIVKKEEEINPKLNQEVIVKEEAKQAKSLNNIDVLVNKHYHLSADAVPTLKIIPINYAVGEGYLAQPGTVDNFIRLVNTMQEETGMTVLVTSAYRSYAHQKRLFNTYANRDGIEAANTYSARAGQSEHQTGLALDVIKPGGSLGSFGGSKESAWVAANAHRFGFIIRYQQGKQGITGYQYEPWHLRYLGEDLAVKVRNSSLTFDEYWAQYLQ